MGFELGWVTGLNNAEALKIIEAGHCLISLRMMSLDKKLDELLSKIRVAEITRSNINELTLEYQRISKEKKHLSSEPGRLEFIEELLNSYYQSKIKNEDVLPL
jgi:hypothetical protein